MDVIRMGASWDPRICLFFKKVLFIFIFVRERESEHEHGQGSGVG